MKNYHRTLAAALLALVALIGCGGGSGGKRAGHTPLTKQQMLEMLNRGVDAAANMGTGSGGFAALQATAVARPGALPTTFRHRLKDGIRPLGAGGGPQYNDFLGLWIEEVLGNNDDPEGPTGFRFWVDEAMTQPGGHEYTYASAGPPTVLRYERELTAGNFAGEWEKTLYTLQESGSGTMTAQEHYPDFGDFEFTGQWDDSGVGVWTGKFTATDGSTESYKLTRNGTTAVFVITSSEGVTYTLNYNEDQSGTGTITGQQTGLPATIVWDSTGAGTITWSDGTTSETTIDPV